MEDFKLVLKVLHTEKVFVPKPQRAHSAFKNIGSDPLLSTKEKLKELYKWL